MTQKGGPRTIVALDYSDPKAAIALAERMEPALCRVKVGKELFTTAGPSVVERLTGLGYDVFLDLKFHDIPNTVAKACEAAADLGVWMMNVHALGGRRMMEAAREALLRRNSDCLLIAVTILTSLDQDDLAEVGISAPPGEMVPRLARLAGTCGLDGVVCSPREAALLKAAMGPDFLLVTPGIRPRDCETADQKRVMTPAEAVVAGSDYLVIGRPVTQAPDPIAVLRAIHREIGELT